jgi:hypothetical protein
MINDTYTHIIDTGSGMASATPGTAGKHCATNRKGVWSE